MQFEHGHGQQADNIIALNEAAGFVIEETAVKVTVPGQAQVRPVFPHRPGRCLPFLRQQRVGHPVRETAVRLVLQFHQGKGQVVLQQVKHRPGTAVTGVDHQFQRPQPLGINLAGGQKPAEVGAFVAAGFGLARLAAGLPHGGLVPGVRGGPRRNLTEAGITAYRPGAVPDQFHAVIVCRIVAGGHHDAAVHPPVLAAENGMVDLFGAAEPEIQDIHPVSKQGFGQRPGQFGAGEAHVPADDDFFKGKQLGKGQADPAGDCRIQLIGHPAPDIIGGKTAQLYGHQ